MSATAAAAAPLDKRPRRNSAKPSPLDPTVVAASNLVEGALKSPMTPKRGARKDDGPRSAPPVAAAIDIDALAAAAAAAAATAPPVKTNGSGESAAKSQQPSTSRQIPPNLDLSPTPTTPNPALRSPRPPIKSAHFDALEAEGERDAMVRTLVLQLQKEMQAEIDRLTAAHRKTIEEKDNEFRSLAELLSKKREEWALQMAAKATIIADQQHDIVGFIKQNQEVTSLITTLENDLEKERDDNEKLRQQLLEFTQPCSSKAFAKPRDPAEKATSNKDSDGFERPTNASTRKVLKRPASDN